MTPQSKRKRIQGKDQNLALRYFKLGTIRARKGKYYEAIKLFKRALKIKPGYAEDLCDTVLVFSKNGKYEQAIKLLNTIIELSPQHVDAYVHLGSIYGTLRKYEEAIIAFNKALDLNPQDINLMFDLADTYNKLCKYDQAAETFNKLLKSQPQNAVAAIAYCGLGTTYSLLERDQEASEAFKKAIEMNYEGPLAYYGLAESYIKLGRFREGVEALKLRVLIDPKNAGNHFLLGCCYYFEEEYDMAIDELTKCLQLGPQIAATYYCLGDSYRRLKRYGEAIEVLEQAVQIGVDDANINCILGIACVLAGAIDKAIKPLERAFELDPENFPAFYFLGSAYRKLHRYKEAINCFEKAIEINPNDSESYYYLSASLFGIGQYNRAASALQTAKDKFLLESNHEGAAKSEQRYLIVSGIINWAEQKYEEARTNFLRASQIVVGGELDGISSFSQFLYELIPIDVDFEELILSSEKIGILTSGIIKLSQKLEDLLRQRQKSELSHPLVEAKSICIFALAFALVEREERPQALETAREIFRYGGFRKLKMATEALERFIYDYIKLYKERNGQLSEGDEATLLNELKPAAFLNGTLSRSFAVRHIEEVQEELLSLDKALTQVKVKMLSVWDGTQKALGSAGQKAEVVRLLLQKEDVYEVYVKGKKEPYPLSHVNNTLRKNKAEYDLWIDEETREVRVKGKKIEPGINVYTLLRHIAKRVGGFCTRAELFKVVWGYEVDDNDRSSTINLQKMFSSYIYKYGKGNLKKLIRGEKHGYSIHKDLNSCLIVSPTSKPSN